MRYGILSDIHGNLEALTACLSYLRDKADFYLCLGDIVGYGPNPNECIEELKKIDRLIVIAGNHDLAVIGNRDIALFNPDLLPSIEWTNQILTEDNKKYIAGLKWKIEREKITAVHASPRDPINEYLFDTFAMKENLDFFSTEICFVGHTHIPSYYRLDKAVHLVGDIDIDIQDKSIINVGSVGQPRDRDNRASCGIYNQEKAKVSIKRIEYDFIKTQSDMIKAGLPDFLIQRLAGGI